MDLSPLEPGEVQWRDQQLQVAQILVERYTGGTDVTLEALDATVSSWLRDDDSRVDVNTFVNGVAIALGEHVARATGLTWVIATDEHGTDLALHGQPGDVLIYPASSVAKRVTAGEEECVRALFDFWLTRLPPPSRP